MSIERRKARKFRKKLFLMLSYFLLLGLLIASYYLFNYFKKAVIINPLQEQSISNIDLEKRLKNAQIAFSSIVLESDSAYIISLTQGGKAIVSSKKNIDEQISSLQRILRELTIEGKPFKIIDFRFEKPVVEFD